MLSRGLEILAAGMMVSTHHRQSLNNSEMSTVETERQAIEEMNWSVTSFIRSTKSSRLQACRARNIETEPINFGTHLMNSYKMASLFNEL